MLACRKQQQIFDIQNSTIPNQWATEEDISFTRKLVKFTTYLWMFQKVRQIRPQDVRTVSEEDMKAMSPERRAMLNKQYTLEFFKPLK